MSLSYLEEPISTENVFSDVGILVVDEDPAFQLGLKTFLKEYIGFENVYIARGGKEAIRMIEEHQDIELVTLDYQMPEMDGLEMLAELKTSAPRLLGITMITGFPSNDLRRDFADCATSKLLTHHLLAKPVEFEKLEPVILKCYQELEKSKRVAEPEPISQEVDLPRELSEQFGFDFDSIFKSNREILGRLDSMEHKIDANTQVVQRIKPPHFLKKWTGDIFKLFAAGCLVIAGFLTVSSFQAGWIDQIKHLMPDLSSKNSSIENANSAEPEQLTIQPTADDVPDILKPSQ